MTKRLLTREESILIEDLSRDIEKATALGSKYRVTIQLAIALWLLENDYTIADTKEKQ